MANVVGSLLVKLGLDAVEFVTGLEKSDREAKKFAASMERDAKRIGAAIGVGVSSAATALFLMTKNAIDAADKLNDLSKSTGISVETLGGLGFAAKQSGTDLDGVAKSVGKLNLQIASAVAGNEQAQKAFLALGISMKQLRESSPDQVLQLIATRFAGYADGPNKAAIANAYFGKSYQSMIPLLNEGGEKLKQNIDYYQKYGGITTETARKADEFNDTLSKVGLLVGQFGRALADELLGPMQGLADAFVEGAEKGNAFKESASDVADLIKGTATAAIYATTEISALGHAFGAIAAQVGAIVRGEFALIGRIQSEIETEQTARFARMNRLVDAINNPKTQTAKVSIPGAGLRNAPGLPDSGAASAAAAVRKAILDAQLKEIDRGIKLEQDLYRDREHFLTQYYQDDLISIAKYYSQKQAFLDDSVRKELASNDAKIALLRGFKPKDEADRVRTEREIADAVANTAKIEREYFNKSIDARIEQTRTVKQYQESLDQLAITLATMRGDTVGAETLSVTAQFADERRRLMAQGTSPADIDEITKRRIDQAKLSDETKKYSNIVEELSIKQARVDLLAQTGSIGEIEALGKKDALAKRFVETLTLQASAYEKIALAMEKGPAKDAALLDIDRMRLGIDQLAASGDSLAKKFNDVFADAFGDNLLAAIDGTKSLKDAFKGMEKDIVHSLNQIAINELKTYLFGGKGALSGAGGAMASLFGGSGSTGNNTGAFAALIASFFGGGSSIGYGTAGSAIPAGPYPYAAGTDFHPGGRARVGEFGPEEIVLPRGAQVIPNHELMESREANVTNYNTTIYQPPGTSRKSRAQAANEATRQQLQAARFT